MHKNVASKAVVDAISKSSKDELIYFGTFATEYLWDSLFDAQLLKEIPIAGSILKALNIAQSVDDRFFAYKILRFLFKINDIDINKRKAFFDKLKDEKERQRVGAKLMLLLRQYDEQEKPDMLARLFASMVEGKLTLEKFFKLATCLSRIFISDISTLLTSYYALKQNKSIHLHNIAALRQAQEKHRSRGGEVFISKRKTNSRTI